MKKIIVFLLMATLFVPYLSSAQESNAQKLEKISSPDQIKNFTNIKKEGNTLFGIKLQNLEKIVHPSELNLFEKIVKIGTALWGYRKISPAHLGTAKLTAETVSCLKPVIDQKDAAVTASLASSSQLLINATNARNACQKTALDIATSTEIIKAFKVCKENFNKAIKDSRMSAKKYREDAWKTYQQEVKACYKSTMATSTTKILDKMIEGGNVLMDDGGNNLDL